MDNTSSEILNSPEYLTRISLVFKHIARIINTQNKQHGIFPHSKEFYAVLSQYVMLECNVLFSSPTERLIKVHIQKRLVSSFTSLLYDTNRRLTRNVRSCRSAALLNILFIFTLVSKECKERYDYLESMAVIIVKELNMMGDFIKLFAERECFSVQKMLRLPHFRIIYRFFQKCNKNMLLTDFSATNRSPTQGTSHQTDDADSDFDDDAPIFNVPHNINGIMLKPRQDKCFIYFLDALATPTVDKNKNKPLQSQKFLVKSPVSVTNIRVTPSAKQPNILRDVLNNFKIGSSRSSELAAILHMDLNKSQPGNDNRSKPPLKTLSASEATIDEWIEEDLVSLTVVNVPEFNLSLDTQISELFQPTKIYETRLLIPAVCVLPKILEDITESHTAFIPQCFLDSFNANEMLQETYLHTPNICKTELQIPLSFSKQQWLQEDEDDVLKPLYFEAPLLHSAFSMTHRDKFRFANIFKANVSIGLKFAKPCNLPDVFRGEVIKPFDWKITTYHLTSKKHKVSLLTRSRTFQVHSAIPEVYSEGTPACFVEILEVPPPPEMLSLSVIEKLEAHVYENRLVEIPGFQVAANVACETYVTKSRFDNIKVNRQTMYLPLRYLEVCLEMHANLEPLQFNVKVALSDEHQCELHQYCAKTIDVHEHKIHPSCIVQIPLKSLNRRLCESIFRKKGCVYSEASEIPRALDMPDITDLGAAINVSNQLQTTGDFDFEPEDQSELPGLVNEIIHMLENSSEKLPSGSEMKSSDNLDMLATVANERSKIDDARILKRKRRNSGFKRRRTKKRQNSVKETTVSVVAHDKTNSYNEDTLDEGIVFVEHSRTDINKITVCCTMPTNEVTECFSSTPTNEEMKLKTIPFKKRKSYRESDEVEIAETAIETSVKLKKRRRKKSELSKYGYRRVTRSITAHLKLVEPLSPTISPRSSRVRSSCILDDADADELVYSVTEEYEDLKNESSTKKLKMDESKKLMEETSKKIKNDNNQPVPEVIDNIHKCDKVSKKHKRVDPKCTEHVTAKKPKKVNVEVKEASIETVSKKCGKGSIDAQLKENKKTLEEDNLSQIESKETISTKTFKRCKPDDTLVDVPSKKPKKNKRNSNEIDNEQVLTIHKKCKVDNSTSKSKNDTSGSYQEKNENGLEEGLESKTDENCTDIVASSTSKNETKSFTCRHKEDNNLDNHETGKTEAILFEKTNDAINKMEHTELTDTHGTGEMPKSLINSSPDITKTNPNLMKTIKQNQVHSKKSSHNPQADDNHRLIKTPSKDSMIHSVSNNQTEILPHMSKDETKYSKNANVKAPFLKEPEVKSKITSIVELPSDGVQIAANVCSTSSDFVTTPEVDMIHELGLAFFTKEQIEVTSTIGGIQNSALLEFEQASSYQFTTSNNAQYRDSSIVPKPITFTDRDEEVKVTSISKQLENAACEYEANAAASPLLYFDEVLLQKMQAENSSNMFPGIVFQEARILPRTKEQIEMDDENLPYGAIEEISDTKITISKFEAIQFTSFNNQVAIQNSPSNMKVIVERLPSIDNDEYEPISLNRQTLESEKVAEVDARSNSFSDDNIINEILQSDVDFNESVIVQMVDESSTILENLVRDYEIANELDTESKSSDIEVPIINESIEQVPTHTVLQSTSHKTSVMSVNGECRGTSQKSTNLITTPAKLKQRSRSFNEIIRSLENVRTKETKISSVHKTAETSTLFSNLDTLCANAQLCKPVTPQHYTEVSDPCLNSICKDDTLQPFIAGNTKLSPVAFSEFGNEDECDFLNYLTNPIDVNKSHIPMDPPSTVVIPDTIDVHNRRKGSPKKCTRMKLYNSYGTWKDGISSGTGGTKRKRTETQTALQNKVITKALKKQLVEVPPMKNLAPKAVRTDELFKDLKRRRLYPNINKTYQKAITDIFDESFHDEMLEGMNERLFGGGNGSMYDDNRRKKPEEHKSKPFQVKTLKRKNKKCDEIKNSPLETYSEMKSNAYNEIRNKTYEDAVTELKNKTFQETYNEIKNKTYEETYNELQTKILEEISESTYEENKHQVSEEQKTYSNNKIEAESEKPTECNSVVVTKNGPATGDELEVTTNCEEFPLILMMQDLTPEEIEKLIKIYTAVDTSQNRKRKASDGIEEVGSNNEPQDLRVKRSPCERKIQVKHRKRADFTSIEKLLESTPTYEHTYSPVDDDIFPPVQVYVQANMSLPTQVNVSVPTQVSMTVPTQVNISGSTQVNISVPTLANLAGPTQVNVSVPTHLNRAGSSHGLVRGAPSSSISISGRSVNISGSSVNISGSSVNISGPINIPGPSINIPGPSINRPAPSVSLPAPFVGRTRRTRNLSGASINHCGPSVSGTPVNLYESSISISAPSLNMLGSSNDMHGPSVSVNIPTSSVNVSASSMNFPRPSINITGPSVSVNMSGPSVKMPTPSKKKPAPSKGRTSGSVRVRPHTTGAVHTVNTSVAQAHLNMTSTSTFFKNSDHIQPKDKTLSVPKQEIRSSNVCVVNPMQRTVTHDQTRASHRSSGPTSSSIMNAQTRPFYNVPVTSLGPVSSVSNMPTRPFTNPTIMRAQPVTNRKPLNPALYRGQNLYAPQRPECIFCISTICTCHEQRRPISRNYATEITRGHFRYRCVCTAGSRNILLVSPLLRSSDFEIVTASDLLHFQYEALVRLSLLLHPMLQHFMYCPHFHIHDSISSLSRLLSIRMCRAYAAAEAIVNIHPSLLRGVPYRHRNNRRIPTLALSQSFLFRLLHDIALGFPPLVMFKTIISKNAEEDNRAWLARIERQVPGAFDGRNVFGLP